MMISGVLTANLQAFHKHSIIVFELLLNIEELIPTRLSNYAVEGKQSRVITS